MEAKTKQRFYPKLSPTPYVIVNTGKVKCPFTRAESGNCFAICVYVTARLPRARKANGEHLMTSSGVRMLTQ